MNARTIATMTVVAALMGFGTLACGTGVAESDPVAKDQAGLCYNCDPGGGYEEPTQTASFNCTGTGYYWDSATHTCYTKTACPTGSYCKTGYVTSTYQCPSDYPYLHCNAFGNCYCSIYP